MRSRRIAVSYYFLADLRRFRFAGAFLATAFLALRFVAGLRFAAALRFLFAMFWTSTLASPTSDLAINSAPEIRGLWKSKTQCG